MVKFVSAARRGNANILRSCKQEGEEYATCQRHSSLEEIVGKQWNKEDELKGLKSEWAALGQKILLLILSLRITRNASFETPSFILHLI